MSGAAGDSAPLGDREFPADPYPGVAPGWSFVHLDGASRRLTPDGSAFAGWRVEDVDLDDWLARHDGAPMAARVPVLAYGSNRCPTKLTWLREHLGLTGPVVMLRARMHDLAAVWAAGLRARDGVRPATLARAPGAVEAHAVWMATPEQVAVLDVCEGRGERYDLVRLRTGRVVTEDGTVVDEPWTYWPASAERAPLLVDGAPVRCSERHHDTVGDLTGSAGEHLDAGVERVEGPPDPASWPARVFVYGTLAPGGGAWPLIAPYARDAPEQTAASWMPGRVHDTGRGYPALRLARDDERDVAHGTVVPLGSASDAMSVLDDYEGPEYRRVRAMAHRVDAGWNTPGSLCWVWVWADPAPDGWPVVHGRWDANVAR